MNIFLTGATGFIGSHFLIKALENGHKITAFKRDTSKFNKISSKSLTWVNGNLDNISNKALKNHDILVHLAAHSANTPYDSLEECIYWNVYAPSKLFKVAYESGIKRFLVTGSCFEYGDSETGVYGIKNELKPSLSYPVSKACASIAFAAFAKEKNISLSYMRIFQAYGEGEKESRFWPSLKKAAISGQDFEMSTGEQIRDFVPVTLIVEKLINEVETKNIPKNGVIRYSHIASGKPSTLKDFALNQWKLFNAKGSIHFGKKLMRNGEQKKIISKPNDIS